MPVARHADLWVTLDGAAEFGAVRRTLYWQIGQNRIPNRRAADGAIEVLAAALPPAVQLRLAEHVAQREAARTREVEELFEAQDVVERLAHLRDAQLAAAMRREAMRRYQLLLAYAAINPKTVEVAGERAPAPALAPIINAWAAADPLVLQARPSWGERGSLRTLRRLHRAVLAHGVAVLLPISTAPQRADDGRVRESDPEVDRAAIALRLTFKNASVQSIYRKLTARFGARTPSIWSIRKLYCAELPKAVEVFANKGPRTYRATLETPLRRDYSKLDVGEVYCGDHHQLDIEIINPARGGRLDRPWVTMWMDLRTRAPVGWHLSFQPNSQTIAAAFVDALQPGGDAAYEHLWGLPASVYIDNGKDYRSQFLEGAKQLADEGVFTLLGVGVTHAKPYNAKAKAVERYFKTLVDQFSRDQETYCGRNPMERTERYRELVASHTKWVESKRGTTVFMTLAELEAKFEAWVIEYLKRPHAGLKEKATGRELAPADVAAMRVQAPRRFDEKTLAYVCYPVERLKVRKGEVRWRSYYYQAPDGELLCFEGETVECRIDPSDVRRMYISRVGGKGICWARSADLLEMSNGETIPQGVIAAAEKQRREEKRVVKKLREFEQYRLDGLTPEQVALAKLDRQPDPPPRAPAAAECVTELRPRLDRAAREAAALADRVPAPPSGAELPPLRTIADAAPALDDRAYAERELDARPADLPLCDSTEDDRRRRAELQAEWDRLAAEVIAARRSTAARAAGRNRT